MPLAFFCWPKDALDSKGSLASPSCSFLDLDLPVASLAGGSVAFSAGFGGGDGTESGSGEVSGSAATEGRTAGTVVLIVDGGRGRSRRMAPINVNVLASTAKACTGFRPNQFFFEILSVISPVAREKVVACFGLCSFPSGAVPADKSGSTAGLALKVESCVNATGNGVRSTGRPVAAASKAWAKSRMEGYLSLGDFDRARSSTNSASGANPGTLNKSDWGFKFMTWKKSAVTSSATNGVWPQSISHVMQASAH